MRDLSKYLVFIVILYCFFVSCTPVQVPSVNKNIAGIYNPSATTLHPNYFVFKQSTDETFLYIKLYTPELYFNTANPENSLRAQVKIFYKITETIEDSNILDSNSTILNIKKVINQNILVTFIRIPKIDKEKYFIQIVAKDILRGKLNVSYIEVNNKSELSAQNFLIQSNEMFKPYFAPFIRPGSPFKLQYRHQLSPELYVNHYSESKKLPLPPYAQTQVFQEFLSDSVFDYNADTLDFKNLNEGIYFFRQDTSVNEGLAIFNFGEWFPEIKKSEQMIPPLQYLMSSLEFEEICKQQNKKLAVDNFWLSTTKDVNQARELLRVYYNRVLYANLYFTSITQGWQTDRGMIYIIFGPPKILQKTSDKEMWTYSDSRNFKNVTFEFVKTQHPFSDNHYILRRDISHKTYWFNAVETWRSGRIYTLDN